MKEKIKVLQITANLGIGGLERVVVNLAKNLPKEKYDVSVCCLKFKGAFAEELQQSGINVYLIPQKKKGTEYFAFLKLQKIINTIKPHIIHSHNSNSYIDSGIARLLCKVPIMIHTDHARKFPDTKRTMLMEWFLSHFVDKIIAVSLETKNNLIRYEHIKQEKIEIVNNGIDASDYDIEIDTDKKKQELNLDSFENIIGLGVRLTKQKGLIHLIHAAPMVLEKYPKTVFLIAGDGGLKKELEQETQKMGLKDNIQFLGARLDMPEILKILDVYVLPSEWEGLPLVILEAMASKRAIVATDVGANAIAIDSGRTGFIVPPKRPDLLAEKIIELIKDSEKRSQFAKLAHRRFYNKFSINHMVDRYDKIYGDALMNKGM